MRSPWRRPRQAGHQRRTPERSGLGFGVIIGTIDPLGGGCVATMVVWTPVQSAAKDNGRVQTVISWTFPALPPGLQLLVYT